ncbi:thiazole synthase, partial [Klebsiella pneumoniae]|nr:thiazole synthase [Klebsiella pneumoniae]
MSDKFILAGKEFSSRLIIGTGKYRNHSEMKAAHKASGAEMVTVAV